MPSFWGILVVYGLPSFLPLPPFPPCFATNVCPCPCPLYCHDTKWQLRGQGQGQTLMAKHGGNGGKGKNGTTKEVKEAVSKRDLTKKFILKKWTKKCETIPNTQSDFSPFFTNVLFSQLLVLLCSFKFCCKTLSMSLIQWWWYDDGIVWFEKNHGAIHKLHQRF